MASLTERVYALERWKADAARELRDVEEWGEEVRPFLEQLQADLIYRQRRHAEAVGHWSLGAKIAGLTISVVVCLATVGGFVLELYIVTHPAGLR